MSKNKIPNEADKNFWNHRVVRRPDTPDGDDHFYIHEAHYSGNLESAPHSITVDSIGVNAESVDALRWVLEKMLASLDKPVLEYDDF